MLPERRVYAWEENEDGVEDPEIAKIRAELGEQVPISIVNSLRRATRGWKSLFI